MVKLLSLLVLVLMLVLLIPTGLVIASQNSVPGETMYPIKRTLENTILIAVGITPWSKAYFQTSRSNSRYKEVRILLDRNENALTTLNELVAQTDDAASAIDNVSEGDRKELREQLIKQLEQYNVTLVAYQQKTTDQSSLATKPSNKNEPSVQQATPSDPTQPLPTQSSQAVTPSPAARNSAQPAPQSPQPSASSSIITTPVQPTTDPAAIQRAIDEIERVRRALAEQAANEARLRQSSGANFSTSSTNEDSGVTSKKKKKSQDESSQQKRNAPAAQSAPAVQVVSSPSPSPSLSPESTPILSPTPSTTTTHSPKEKRSESDD